MHHPVFRFLVQFFLVRRQSGGKYPPTRTFVPRLVIGGVVEESSQELLRPFQLLLMCGTKIVYRRFHPFLHIPAGITDVHRSLSFLEFVVLTPHP